MSQFHTLSIAKIKQLTTDTVSISFDIPTNLAETFNYISGQYLTLKFNINGNDERRAYSLSSSSFTDGLLEVAVKQVENGIVSTYINNELKEGDSIEVMPPQGNFILETNKDANNHYVAFAAGSGITPIISMVKSVLSQESDSKFTLVYGNKTKESTIFYSELEGLKNDCFDLISVYSRENTGEIATEGRINKERVDAIFKQNLDLLKADKFYMCGPEEMIVAVDESLKTFGVSKTKINYELFTPPILLAKETPKEEESNFDGEATVKVIYDDEEVEFTLNSNGLTILDAAMKEDVDVPFSCKGVGLLYL